MDAKIDLRCGDCLEVMKTIDKESIDFVITSPPYDDLRTYKGYSFKFEEIAKEIFRILKKGGVVVKTTKGSTKIRLIINEGLLIGLLKSKNGTITLKPVDNEIMATYYSRETSKLAKKLKLMGKYGVENKFGVTSDGEVKIQTPKDLNEIIAALNTKKSTEKGTKVLAKKQKK